MLITKGVHQKSETRKKLILIRQDLEYQIFRFQKQIFDIKSGIGSLRNQIAKIDKDLQDDIITEIVQPVSVPTHSDPVLRPEIQVKPNTISNSPNFVEKRVGLTRLERLKVPCSLCGQILANRIKLKEHKYQFHSS